MTAVSGDTTERSRERVERGAVRYESDDESTLP